MGGWRQEGPSQGEYEQPSTSTPTFQIQNLVGRSPAPNNAFNPRFRESSGTTFANAVVYRLVDADGSSNHSSSYLNETAQIKNIK